MFGTKIVTAASRRTMTKYHRLSNLQNKLKSPCCRFQSVVAIPTTSTRNNINKSNHCTASSANAKQTAPLSTLMNGSDSRTKTFTPTFLAATTALLFNLWMNQNDEAKCSASKVHPSPTPVGVGTEKHFEDKVDKIDDLPVYTSEQVANNDGTDGKPIWMTYGGVVYDVTDFIHNHPGGSERILLAAGSAVEPYWHIYRQHFASDLPMRLMEKLIIGRLDEKDQEAIEEQMEKIMEENDDPYLHEPTRSEKLIVHSDQPMNAEVPNDIITDNYITPVELFYIRHHHPVPLLYEDDLKKFRLEIDVSEFAKSVNISTKGKCSTRKISIDDIKKLPKVEVTTTLQCSGNRRGDMNNVQRTSGTAWGQGAISTAKWGGARLVDVLKLAGVENPYDLTNENGTQKHVRFESIDGMKASINMEKATNPYGDVIIAYEMNDEPIPRDHGFPLRAIVPGYSAVRNVKWVKKIELSNEEAEGAWQRGLNYKTLPPNIIDAKSIDLDAMPSMTESSLFSGITKMEVDKTDIKKTKGGTVLVKAKGWAWAGGGRNVVRVDVTGDGGKTWQSANIVEGGNQKFGRAWAWVFWEVSVPATVQKDGSVKLASKAVDMAFNSQPENAAHGWNVRGLGNNSWYRAEMKV